MKPTTAQLQCMLTDAVHRIKELERQMAIVQKRSIKVYNTLDTKPKQDVYCGVKDYSKLVGIAKENADKFIARKQQREQQATQH